MWSDLTTNLEWLSIIRLHWVYTAFIHSSVKPVIATWWNRTLYMYAYTWTIIIVVTYYAIHDIPAWADTLVSWEKLNSSSLGHLELHSPTARASHEIV